MTDQIRSFHLKVGQANLHGSRLSGAELASAVRDMRLDVVCVQEPFTSFHPHVQTPGVRVALGKVDQETGLVNTAIVVPDGVLGCMVLDQLTCEYFVAVEIAGLRRLVRRAPSGTSVVGRVSPQVVPEGNGVGVFAMPPACP